MNGTELAIQFPSSTEVNVSFEGTDSGKMAFVNPVSDKDRTDIKWYVETYGAQSLADPDDAEAKRIKARLPEIGKALFSAVFGKTEAYEPYLDFRNKPSANRVLTISSQDAGILALPWELLHDPKGVFLFREKPYISIRRKITGATKGRAPFAVEAKDHLHLLFVVSRPSDAGFIDPRADPQAVIDDLEQHAPGRVTWEFLRPATLNALVARLDDETKPSVDILHFDGHGVFRQVSEEDIKRKPDLFGKSLQSEIQRERQVRGQAAAGKPIGVGFLVFEKDDGLTHLIPAEDLAENLYRSKVALVVLSACQTATLDAQGDPMASVAGRLTTTGIPSILAMTHAVLVPTTRILFSKFYESLARSRTNSSNERCWSRPTTKLSFYRNGNTDTIASDTYHPSRSSRGSKRSKWAVSACWRWVMVTSLNRGRSSTISEKRSRQEGQQGSVDFLARLKITSRSTFGSTEIGESLTMFD